MNKWHVWRRSSCRRQQAPSRLWSQAFPCVVRRIPWVTMSYFGPQQIPHASRREKRPMAVCLSVRSKGETTEFNPSESFGVPWSPIKSMESRRTPRSPTESHGVPRSPSPRFAHEFGKVHFLIFLNTSSVPAQKEMISWLFIRTPT